MLAEVETAQAVLADLQRMNDAIGELAAIQSDSLVALLGLLPLTVSQPPALEAVGDGIEHARRAMRVLESLASQLERIGAALTERGDELNAEARA